MLTEKDVNDIAEGWGNWAVDTLARDWHELKSQLAQQVEQVAQLTASLAASRQELERARAALAAAYRLISKIIKFHPTLSQVIPWMIDTEFKATLDAALSAQKE